MSADALPDQSISDLPGDVVQQCETGDILGTCDWGHCNGETAGWARSAADCRDDVLTVCADHLKHGTDEYPVTESWSFAQVERVLGWQEGAIQGGL